jgi:DNA-binding MarR family transcriptional regulator
MTKTKYNLRSRASDLKKLDPLDDALELMFFGWSGLIRKAEVYFASIGLTRTHRRILYIIARHEGVTIGNIQLILGISKQALHRPMKQLLEEKFVVAIRNPKSHRFKMLHLTPKGRKAEAKASSHERRIMNKAFMQVGNSSRKAWSEIMAFLAQHG